jgi:type II secretory pathway component GspD/PulD (secretin)
MQRILNLTLIFAFGLFLGIYGTRLWQRAQPPALVMKAKKEIVIQDTESRPPDEPRTFEFQQDDIGLVLRTLARQDGTNAVVSQQIAGNVTLRLVSKTPKEAMDIICQSNNLFMDELNGVTYIKTQTELAREPTEFAQFTFKRAKVADVVKIINTEMKSGVEPQFDLRTNTIFYHERRSNMKKLQELINFLDSPVGE